ncbi:hypothetical protein FQA39_LY06499 [Lamprigera yunnana]|nr:hypothetical protein FQA39_LY06499 [Lamprigera yunnana]
MNLNPNSFGVECDAKTREEYMEKLNNWFEEVRRHQELAKTSWLNFLNQVPLPQNLNLNLTTNAHAPPPRTNNSQRSPVRFYVYKIPPLWKRLMAEVIDFLILFLLKLLFTITVLEAIELIYFDSDNAVTMHSRSDDPQISLQMTYEFIVVEFLHRCFVWCYETYFVVLQGATPGKRYMGLTVVDAMNVVQLQGQLQNMVLISPATKLTTYFVVLQGATPGKRYMGLTVVDAMNVVQLQGQLQNMVLISPATKLTVKNAIIRSMLKTIVMCLLLPFCSLFFYQYNRTKYDLIANSLVVEYNPNPPVQEHH